MAARPVFHKDLAKFFTDLRMKAGWEQREAERKAEEFGLCPPLTRQVIRGLEDGRTKNPKPEVLRAVATLYGKSYDELIARFVAARYGISDLIRQSRDQASDPHEGGSDVPASERAVDPRIQQLTAALEDRQRAIADRDRIIARAEEIARSMWELLLATKDQEARKREARSRRTHRKTRG